MNLELIEVLSFLDSIDTPDTRLVLAPARTPPLQFQE